MAYNPDAHNEDFPMIIRRPDDIPSSEITPEREYLGRREFIRKAGIGGAARLLPRR